MKRVILSLLIIIPLCSLGSTPSYAAKNEAEYDLEQGGTQQFILIDEDSEEIIITVEEELDSSKVVKNGTYKITSERKGSWKASYDLVVKGNVISTAKNPSAIAYTGSFISKSLKVETSKQATYYLTKKTGIISADIKVRATLKNDSISITN